MHAPVSLLTGDAFLTAFLFFVATCLCNVTNRPNVVANGSATQDNTSEVEQDNIKVQIRIDWWLIIP